MTSGTKVLLALIGLFVGILVLYYGFLMPSAPPGSVGVARDPVLEKTPSVAAPPPPTETVKARQVKPFAAAETGTLEAAGAPDGARSAGAAAATVAGALGGATSPLFDRPSAATPPASPPKTAPAAPVRTASAESRQATSPPAAEFTPYVVREGDTLASIAYEWFGDERKWDLIAQANDVDPRRLKIGRTLKLPPRDVARAPVRKAAGTGYTVRAGDSLSSIAFAHYGDRTRWKDLYAANRDRIGPDPDALVVGMTLRIP